MDILLYICTIIEDITSIDIQPNDTQLYNNTLNIFI